MGMESTKMESETKERVLIFGCGNFYLQNEKSLNDKYDVIAFLDNHKNGCFSEREIIRADQILRYEYNKIVIMMQNIQECINTIRDLIDNYGINYEQIVLGHALYGKVSEIFDSVKVSCDGKLLLYLNGISLKVGSLDEFNNVWEVLVNKVYSYFINNKKKDVVLDVGMNIGDAVLYFLSDSKVEKVYAFEPFKNTFMAAKENLSAYLDDTDRLEIFQFGISDKNEMREIGFNEGMTCGQSTVGSIRQEVYEQYYSGGLVKPEDEQLEKIEVKDAIDVFTPILKQHIGNNIVLKMDCEGEEYGIIRELSESKLLEKFDFIMLEWHYNGKEDILKYLNESGFSYWCADLNDKMGSIYAYHV